MNSQFNRQGTGRSAVHFPGKTSVPAAAKLVRRCVCINAGG